MRTALRIGLPLFAVLAVSAVALSACDSANMLAMLTTEVKKSTGRLLIVSGVTPTHTATNVNPGARMAVTFDRAVDLSTVNGSTVTISPPQVATGFHLDFSYNDATRTLYIDSDPWLDENRDCTLTVTTGVKGVDGTDVGTNYSWSFTTGVAPKGTLKIEGGKLFTNKGAGQVLSLDLTCDDTFYSYYLAATEAGLAGATPNPMPGGVASITGDTSAGYQFAGADGLQTVYYRFKTLTGTYSAVRSTTITLDTVKPTITAPATVYHNVANLATGVIPAVSGSDDRSGIDAATWTWSAGATPVVISPLTGSPAPYLSLPSDSGPYGVTVTVRDKAGNAVTAASMINVVRDTGAPNPPTFNAGTTASPTVLDQPTWAWTPGTGGGQGWQFYLVNPLGEKVFKDDLKPPVLTLPDAKYLEVLLGNKVYPLAPDGTWTLYLRDSDAAGNYSTYAPGPILTTPCIPINKATGVAGSSVTFQWRPFGKGAPYELVARSTGVTVDVGKLETNSYTCTVDLSGLTVEWFVVDRGGAKSPAYTFTTKK